MSQRVSLAWQSWYCVQLHRVVIGIVLVYLGKVSELLVNHTKYCVESSMEVIVNVICCVMMVLC